MAAEMKVAASAAETARRIIVDDPVADYIDVWRFLNDDQLLNVSEVVRHAEAIV